MSILKPHTLAERIIAELGKGSARGPELMERLDHKDQHYTKQALYSALRQLKKEDVVVSQRGEFALNTTWILKLQSFASEAGRQYGAIETAGDILNLAQGESVTYAFTNSRTLDAFWGHAQNILLTHTSPNDAVYAFDPHYWFLIAREDTETTLLRHITSNNRQFLMAVGGDTPLDKELTRHFDGTSLQYTYAPLFKSATEYVSVVGTYIVTVTLDQKIADQVEHIFQTVTRPTQDAITQLQSLLELRSRNKIKISNNPRRAALIKAKFKKYFFIKI